MARVPCGICGTPFYLPPSQAKRGGKYCSYKCAGDSRRKTEFTRKCKKCGISFLTTDRSARRCESCKSIPVAVDSKGRVRFRRYAPALAMNACATCGKPARRTYCGRACYAVSRIKVVKAPLPMNSTCALCGRGFYASPFQKRNGWGRLCSIACRTKDMKHTSRGRGGTRPDLGIYVRSSWEANYARYLKWLQGLGEIERWEYEPDTFEFPVKRGSRFYTPDFKVFERGSFYYVEVKGYMDERSATKLKRMALHHPQVKVVIVASKEMAAIYRAVGAMVPHWERNSNDKMPVA